MYFLGLVTWLGKTLGPTHSTPVMVEGYSITILPVRTDVYMYTEWSVLVLTPPPPPLFINSAPISLWFESQPLLVLRNFGCQPARTVKEL